jgi:hypothetical protein
MADRLAHPPHLAVAAFTQRDVDERVRAARRVEPLQHADVGGSRAVAVERDAAAEALDRGGVGHAADARPVDLRHLVPRVHELCRQLAVIGEQQQAFRVVVEAADGVEVAEVRGNHLEHRAPPLRIGARRHHAGRLVDQHVAQRHGGLDLAAVDGDGVGPGVGLGAEVQHRGAVDGHPALDDEALGGPARGHAGRREDLLQAFHLCSLRPRTAHWACGLLFAALGAPRRPHADGCGIVRPPRRATGRRSRPSRPGRAPSDACRGPRSWPRPSAPHRRRS